MTQSLSELGFEIHRLLQQEDVLVTFAGALDSKALNSLVSNIENQLGFQNLDPTLQRRIYHVMVECVENVYYHTLKDDFEGSRKTQPFGIVSLIRKNNDYYLTTGNRVLNSEIEQLSSMLERLNSLSMEEKKESYNQILKNREFSSKGGAGLGLHEIAIRASGDLSFEFNKVDETRSFFIFQAKILS